MEQVHICEIQVVALVETMVVVQELLKKVTKSENHTYSESIMDEKVIQKISAIKLLVI